MLILNFKFNIFILEFRHKENKKIYKRVIIMKKKKMDFCAVDRINDPILLERHWYSFGGKCRYSQ